MELWEGLLDGFEGALDVGSFSKVTQTAETVLKEDLAAFEIEWIAATLLFEPVSLLELISARARDDAWSKPLTDSFKVIATLVDKYPDSIANYYEDIVKTCQAPLEARSRAAALQCLAACFARPLRGFSNDDVDKYIAALENPVTCKAPFAALVCAICEHHPEAVTEDTTRILRAYLNMLECNKNTDAVCCAALRGVAQLLRHYGDSLPVRELDLLYTPLAGELFNVPACRAVIVEILRAHAPLFRERLAADRTLRLKLWAAVPERGRSGACAAAACVTVYEAALSVPGEQQKSQSILEAEIYPRTSDASARIKFTALRVASRALAHDPAGAHALHAVDVLALEFQLRTEIGAVPDYIAEAVSWCIETGVAHSDVLLQTAILFHERLPAARVRDIVVNGLRAAAARADASLSFLMNETCQEGGFEQYRALWGVVLEGDAAGLCVWVLRRAAGALRGAPDQGGELPADILPLLRVAALALQAAPAQGGVLSAALSCALRCTALPAPVLSLLPLLPDSDDVRELYERLDIERMPDEESMCACAVALLHAPPDAVSPRSVLLAVQIVVTRRDAEPATLSLALARLDDLLEHRESLDEALVRHVIRLVDRLRTRTDLVGKEARVLHRDVLLFLGKHWDSGAGCDNADNIEIEATVVKLRDLLVLSLPQPSGDDYQINVQRILLLALKHEDHDSLEMLTAIICAHPSLEADTEAGAALRGALAQVMCARAHAAARGAAAAPPVPPLPLLAAPLLTQVATCASPGVRQVLCDALPALLRGDTLRHVARQVADMLDSPALTSRLGGLDACSALLSALQEHSLLVQEYLPRLLLLIAATNEPASRAPFQQAAVLYSDKRDLFGAAALDTTVADLLQLLMDLPVTRDAQLYKATVEMILDFLKTVCDSENLTEVSLKRDGDSAKWLYVVAELKSIGLSDLLLERSDFQKLYKLNRETDFETEVVLVFVTQFADVLLESYNEETITLLGDMIEQMPAARVSALRVRLAACVTAVSRGAARPSHDLCRRLERWADAQPLAEIADHIRRHSFPRAHRSCVSALLALLEALSPPHPAQLLTRAAALASAWPRAVLDYYAEAPAELESQTAHLTGVLAAALRVDAGDVRRLLSAGHTLQGAPRATLGVDFCRHFMPAFHKYLLRRPFVLCEPGMEACCTLLRDVVQYSAESRGGASGNVVELADELWESFVEGSDFATCGAVVVQLVRLGATARSRCVAWALRVVADPQRPLDARSALLPALPAGEDSTSAFLSFACALPARLSECSREHARALRAVLDAVAVEPHPVLLDLLVRLAAGDESAGWWDAAMEACMASLALRGEGSALSALFRRLAHDPLSVAACERLFVPLLSYSPAGACKRFFGAALPQLLAELRTGQVAASPTGAYHRCVVRNTRHVTLLRLMVEKVARGSLESPASALHAGLSGSAAGNASLRPWHAVRETCKLCMELKKRTVVPENATSELARAVLTFKQGANNTLAACVSALRAEPRVYRVVLGDAWDEIVGSEHYSLPLRARQRRRTLVAAGGAGVAAGGGSTGGGSTRGGSTRQRVFLRTLSECPNHFDLFEEEEEQSERVELVVSSGGLNAHPCAASLSALLRHLAAAPASEPAPAWPDAVAAALVTARTNVRWLLAQCVVNVRVELKAHASALTPALLAVVADTTEGGLINFLHMDILQTVCTWAEGGATPAPALSTATAALVRTCVLLRDSSDAPALLECCTALFRAFRPPLPWEELGQYLDDPSAAKVCFKLLLRAAKEGVHTPELVPALLERMAKDHREHYQVSDRAKLFGAGVATCDSVAAHAAWADYGKLASRVKATSVGNYIDMLHYSTCTDMQHFRSVADVAQKAPALRSKCLSILAACLRAAVTARSTAPAVALAALPRELRQELEDLCPEWAFEELVSPPPGSPPAKRARLAPPPPSPLLGTRDAATRLARVLATLKDKEARLDEKLAADDMPLRFVECFYVCVYVPLKHSPSPSHGGGASAPACLTAALRLWLRRARTLHNFRRASLPHPAGASEPSRAACVGSLRTHAAAARTVRTARTARTTHATTQGAAADDARISLERVLDTFLNFGQSNGCASAWLTAQVWRACSARAPAALSAALVSMLADLLDVAPPLLSLTRELAPTLQEVDGLADRVEALWETWAGTEAEPELRLLREELQLRSPAPDLFVLGNDAIDDEECSAKLEPEEFTIEGLVSACGALAAWDTLTRQQRRRAACVPPLWTDRDDFRRKLEHYQAEGLGWFQCMVRAWRGERRDAPRWERAAAAWPRRRAALEALADARGAGASPPPRFAPQDCLAEWAARLMLRSLYLREATDDDALSRSHELLWCRCAIERGLPRLALQCVQRNTTEEMSEREALSWLSARAHALHAQAGAEGGRDLLQKALDTAERHGPRLFPAAATTDVLELCALILQLRTDLDSLSEDRVEEVVQWAGAAVRGRVTSRDKDSLRALSEAAVLYYDNTWDQREPDASLSAMCGALSVAAAHGCACAAGVAAALRRLSDLTGLGETAADRLLRTVLPLLELLPACYRQRLQRCLPAVPPRALAAHAHALHTTQPDSDYKFRRRMQLLCGAEPALLQHCDTLAAARDKHDGAAWAAAFLGMQQEVFDNECAGADYRALHKHKAGLYAVREYEDTPEWRSQSRLALQNVVASLRAAPRARRSVAALCPALCTDAGAAAALAALLRLPKQDVLGLDDEIAVFTDAVSAPGVVCVRTRGGRRRYLLKRARLARDAAAAAAAALLVPDHHVPEVILVTEECGLIEYLEEHVRMRDLVQEDLDLNAIPIERQARRNEELVLASAAAAERNFAQICSAAPPTALRRAIERRCADADGFLLAREQFRRDLVSMTVLTWLLGLGDRHLNNIMVGTAVRGAGSVRAVDWGALFQYGLHELPPARLTRVLQAVCPDGIEAALQQTVLSLRARRRALLPVLRLALGDTASTEQLSTMERLLSGSALPCAVTQQSVLRGDVAHAEHYVQLVRDACAGAHRAERPVYSVEEQVACLLRQSTAPRVLSVTRSEWEPWL